MWPTLKQPWYFGRPSHIAVDSKGIVYVRDSDSHRIQKFYMDLHVGWNLTADGVGWIPSIGVTGLAITPILTFELKPAELKELQMKEGRSQSRYYELFKTKLEADMAVDGNGRLWVAPWGEGVLAFDGREWRQYLAGLDVNRLAVAPDGGVFAAALSSCDPAREGDTPRCENPELERAGLYVITPEAMEGAE